jgi:Fuc2NAc and GlcNAc transferase
MSFTDPVFILLHLAGFAFMISLAVSGFMISAGLLDKPVARSNHKEDIPTAGGVGIAAGTGAGLLALALFYPGMSNQSLLGAISAILLGVGFVGLVDDIYDTRALVKFVVMVALAAIAVATIGPPTSMPISVLDISLPYWVAFAGSILWVFVMANGINFMDGANGLMGGFMAVAFVFLAIVALMYGAVNTVVLSTVIAAAIAGFLPYNWKTRAHIFSGDVGALFVGFGYAICVLLLVRETDTDGLLFVGPLLVLPFLTDILLTMLARARRKENLMSPHSSHIYQRLIKKGYSHTIISLMYVWGALIAGVTTLIAVWVGLHRSFFFLGLAICVWVFIYLVLHQKLPNGRGSQQK